MNAPGGTRAVALRPQPGSREQHVAPLGTTVSWNEFTSGPPLLEALGANALDFGSTGDVPPLFAQAAGGDLLYVAATKGALDGSAIVVKKDSPARALVSRPDFLALDEPLGALDALSRITMQGLVERVWREQKFTALFVTHDVGEAVALADRVIVLDEGRIALDVSVDHQRPRERGTAHLAQLEGLLLKAIFA